MKAITLVVACLAAMLVSGSAADFTLKTADKAPPKEIGEAIQKVLTPKAVQLLSGDKPLFEFWWRKDLPLKGKPESAGKALDAVAEMTLMGAVALSEGHRDYKDNEIPAGSYTVRFGLQPQDGDHLGTSEFLYFAVLIPAKADPEPEGIKTYKAMVKASGKATPAGHPAVLSLRPAATESGDAPTLTTPAEEHKAIRFNVPAKSGDQTVNLPFELVYEGKFKG